MAQQPSCLPMVKKIGATLDRNGLRPSRYYVTDDDYIVMSSEVGVLDFLPHTIVKKRAASPWSAPAC